MDDECFEDTICIVNYTESQKSIATTHAFSHDCTDSSSGKESRRTYVIEVDSDRSDAPRARAARARPADADTPTSDSQIVPLVNDENSPGASDGRTPCMPINNRSLTAKLHTYSIVSQESFTQTSKTIFELAQINDLKCTNTNAIETQTSQVSIIENKTIEYRIQVSGSHTRFSRHELLRGSAPAPTPGGLRAQACWLLHAAAGASGTDSVDDSDKGSSETLRIIDDGPKPTFTDRLEPSDKTSENADTSKYDTDFNDSLEENDHVSRDARDDTSERSVSQSVDKDVEELYDKLGKSFDLRSVDRPEEFDIPRHITLTPLTEETTGKVEGVLELSRKECIKNDQKEVTNKKNCIKSELTIGTPPITEEYKKQWRLPPIHRSHRAGSPRRPAPDRWETRAGGLAAGEGADVTARTGSAASPQLPSIYLFGTGLASRGDAGGAGAARPHQLPCEPRETSDAHYPRPRPTCDQRETISIHNKIQQLKMPGAVKKRTLYSSTTTGSRSSSPDSTSCGGAGAGAEATARGCEALCADVVARLRRHVSCARSAFEPSAGGARGEGSDGGANWAEAVAVLEEIPVRFRGFWAALPEHRVADLLRLVTAQVESPRTRVARAACATLAAILTHTNYTKKPDFCEAVTALLVKTGSCVRPLRRAANVALDAVVARVELSHAVTALCLFGVEHKSPAVRCAAARLLVVCAALARGGRGLLRAHPPSAAHARRHALRALSALLHDRIQDTRKYAERLYSMLRPLAGFEAFFLADVGARTACRQLGHYDALLAPAPR